VCTPAVLVNLLAKGSEYMCLSRINLLILDECHHAKKGTKAPYVLLMSKYDPHAEQKPRVLGMTVSGPSHLISVSHPDPEC
jgi:ERCC4-related helicase